MAHLISNGRYRFISPDKKLYLGYAYEKENKLAMDKRCEYCGRYFCFDVKKCDEWRDNIKIGFGGWPEKIHCGSLHCQDYHRRVLAYQEKMQKNLEQKHFGLFQQLKRVGVIA